MRRFRIAAFVMAVVALHPAPHARQEPVSPATQALGKGWDPAYENPAFNLEPNAFLVAVVKDLKPGTALDVGMGQGRNALFLARQGWRATGFDVSGVAVRKAREAARTTRVDLSARVQSAEEFNWGEERWDLIVVTYFPRLRNVMPQIVASLTRGGHLVVEAYHADIVLDRPAGAGAGVTFQSGELRTLIAPLSVVRYEEPRERADWGMFETRLVRLLAQKAP